MNSVIKVTFTAHKTFDVEIDNIEQITPRGMELMFAAIEKRFSEMKGRVGTEIREAERKQRAEDERAAAEAQRLAELEQEEIAKRRNDIEKAARKRLKDMTADEAERTANALIEKQKNKAVNEITEMLQAASEEGESAEDLLAELLGDSSEKEEAITETDK